VLNYLSTGISPFLTGEAVEWVHVNQYRGQCHAVANVVMNRLVLEFFDQPNDSEFIKKCSAPCIWISRKSPLQPARPTQERYTRAYRDEGYAVRTTKCGQAASNHLETQQQMKAPFFFTP
jgi:hypothetical protein